MQIQKPTIVFTGKMRSAFIQRDYELLQKHYDIYPVDLPYSKLELLIYPIKLLKWVRRSDLLISEFNSWHSALGVFYCRLFNKITKVKNKFKYLSLDNERKTETKHSFVKKSIIVVGGYDVAYLPQYDYGVFCHVMSKVCAMYGYNHANKFIAIGPSLKDDVIKNAGVDSKEITVIPRGHNSNFYTIANTERTNMVITIASVISLPRYKIKGLDVYLKVARQMPDIHFVIIGVNKKIKAYIEKRASSNVAVIGYSSQETLRDYFQKAKVYCQLSVREGFGNCLCESMLCGCMGVATNTPALKFVLGDTGYTIEYGDIPGIIEAIRNALNSTPEERLNARKHALQFSDEKRLEGIKKIIQEIYGPT
jgi:glycosyltransferase involved in cell wall biosynthesis